MGRGENKRFLVGAPIQTDPRIAIHASSMDEAAIAYFRLKPQKKSFVVWSISGKEKHFFFSDIEEIIPDADRYLNLSEAEKEELKRYTWEECDVSAVDKEEHEKVLGKLSTVGLVMLALAVLLGRYLYKSFLNGELFGP